MSDNDECGIPGEHVPVLAEELAQRIRLATDGVIVDATVGHGGHSRLLGRALGPAGTVLGLDVDQGCIARARSNLSGLQCRVILVRANFANAAEISSENHLGQVDLILADLGFCSGQIEDERRGLSFQRAMPLDMRLDDRLRRTAADIVNQADETTLADLLYRYGEERAARRIARMIVEHRRQRPIRTTTELAGVVCRALGAAAGGRRQKIHPATRTFQALRIAVNDELGNLDRLLNAAPGLLRPGGHVAVISFHSLEDRIVKYDFRRRQAEGVYEIVTPRPIEADRAEIERNPRARSAKLRIARRR